MLRGGGTKCNRSGNQRQRSGGQTWAEVCGELNKKLKMKTESKLKFVKKLKLKTIFKKYKQEMKIENVFANQIHL